MKAVDPTVSVFNRQRKQVVDTGRLLSFLQLLASRLELKAGFSVVLLSDLAMQRYNREFAHQDRPTDVLSFPAGEDELDPYLGDVLISVETANRQSSSSLDEELQILSLHGLLHLLGYDHVTDNGRMDLLERSLRGEFGLS